MYSRLTTIQDSFIIAYLKSTLRKFPRDEEHEELTPNLQLQRFQHSPQMLELLHLRSLPLNTTKTHAQEIKLPQSLKNAQELSPLEKNQALRKEKQLGWL